MLLFISLWISLLALDIVIIIWIGIHIRSLSSKKYHSLAYIAYRGVFRNLLRIHLNLQFSSFTDSLEFQDAFFWNGNKFRIYGNCSPRSQLYCVLSNDKICISLVDQESWLSSFPPSLLVKILWRFYFSIFFAPSSFQWFPIDK